MNDKAYFANELYYLLRYKEEIHIEHVNVKIMNNITVPIIVQNVAKLLQGNLLIIRIGPPIISTFDFGQYRLKR